MLTQDTPPEPHAEMVASIAERDRHFRWNFAVMGIDITLFTLATSISSAYVVLPLFVHHLHHSNIAAELVPAVRALGLFGPQLLIAGYVERLRRTKPILLGVTVLERVPYLVLAVAALLLARQHPFVLLVLFFLLILAQTFGSALSVPPWLDMVARAMPENWRGRFFGLWSGLGGFLGIGGAALATFFLSAPDIDYPANFALCFALTFAAMVLSFLSLSLTREPRRIPHPPEQRAERRAAGETGPHGWLRLLRRDHGFRGLLIANAIYGLATLAVGLYAVAAKNVSHLTDGQVSLQNSILAFSAALSNILLGLLGDRYGHRLVLEIGALAGGLAAFLALVANGLVTYTGIFLLTGVSLSAFLLAFFAFVVEFGTPETRPTYIALSGLCYAPFSTFAPVLGGWLADHFGYGPPFLLAGTLGLGAALAYRLWVPDPRMHKRRAAATAGTTPAQTPEGTTL